MSTFCFIPSLTNWYCSSKLFMLHENYLGGGRLVWQIHWRISLAQSVIDNACVVEANW